MTSRNRILAIAGFGALTALTLAVGAGTLGGLLALVQLCFLIGLPIALLVADDLRSRAAVVVLAATLSIAISAIAVQSLVWFRLASAEAIVVLATVYGVVLAQLLSTASGRGNADLGPTGAGRW